MRRTTNTAVRRVADLPIAIATDVGIVRTENQDRGAILRFHQTKDIPIILSIVCDGMGGMIDGSICSSLAISTFLSSYIQNTSLLLKDRIIKSAMDANDAVFSKYNGNGGATLSALVVENQKNILGVNIGDSRIYSIEDNKFSQLTIDDTLAGQFAQEHSDAYRQNDLLQYIGMGHGIEPHIISFSETSNSPSILLTSDGVHFLEKRTMELLVKHASDSALAVRRLIELSKWCGGHDNASAIIINLSTLAQERININPGELEVWDAFGELRLITTPSPDLYNQHSKKTFEITTANEQKATPTLTANKKPRTRKRSPPNPKGKARKIIGIEDEQADSTIAPQLQIDFDDK